MGCELEWGLVRFVLRRRFVLWVAGRRLRVQGVICCRSKWHSHHCRWWHFEFRTHRQSFDPGCINCHDGKLLSGKYRSSRSLCVPGWSSG